MIRWHAIAKCDHWSGCLNEVEVTLTMTHERKVDIKTPAGWQAFFRASDDSQRDVDHIDLDGGSLEVLCPDHA